MRVSIWQSVIAVFWTMSIVYILIKLQRFGSWIFFHLLVKRGRTETLAVGPPGWASLRPGRWWTMSIKPLLQIVTHHRQNPLDFIWHSVYSSVIPPRGIRGSVDLTKGQTECLIQDCEYSIRIERSHFVRFNAGLRTGYIKCVYSFRWFRTDSLHYD
jgi:hypothetical protein